MAELPMILTSFTTMAVLAAGLGALFPAAHRPWWHARPRLVMLPLHNEAATTVPVLPEEAEAAPIATVAPLQLVSTEDRRRQSLPFVGRDRRKVARAEGRATDRRDGTAG